MPINVQLLEASSKGTPLIIIATADYQHWLQNQPESWQRWLAAIGYNGEGRALIAEDASLVSVVIGVPNLNDVWLLGDEAAALPSGQYHLSADANLAYNAALSWLLGSYQFDRYQAAKAPNQATLSIIQAPVVEKVRVVAESISLARDLINTPAADMMPEHLAETCHKLAERFTAEVTDLVGDELLQQNYPTIHAVGRASIHPPRLLDLRFGHPDHPKVTLVGKGVCFDSGGLNLKPSNNMRWMKKDMGGAAHVLALAQMVMALALPVRLRVLIPAVENAVASNAFRPGDVIKTRQGLTVEIDNTDAEGRLVLCDALTEAATDQPELLIDFATLTGAARVAVGTELPAFFSNDQTLAQSLMQQGQAVQDPLWQLPLHQPYNAMLKSDVADLVNSASTPFGGAITAALYLEHFVGQTPWLHFDVMAFNQRALPGRPKGGEALGLRAVLALLESRYNPKEPLI